MKYLKDKQFKLLKKKNWDYGHHPTKVSRLGKGILRQRLSSKLMQLVLKSYIKTDKKLNKYPWIAAILDKYKFYVFNKIKEDGSIIYDGIDLSKYAVLTGFNLSDQLLTFHGINPKNAKKESKHMVFLQMIDKPKKVDYIVQLIIEVDGDQKTQFIINTFGQSSLDEAFSARVWNDVYISAQITCNPLCHSFIT